MYVTDVPAVWVRVSAQEHTVTVRYVDMNGNFIDSTPYDTYPVPNGGTFTLSNSQMRNIPGYTFNNQWRVGTTESWRSPPISYSPVTGPITVYLRYAVSAQERYQVTRTNNPGTILSTWRWLADAVYACGTDGPYTITATENDIDVTDLLGNATAAGGTWQNFINSTPTSRQTFPSSIITIPSNKNITLTSSAGAWTITNRSYSRHLNVQGSLTLNNIILDGMGYTTSPGGGFNVNGGISVLAGGTLTMNTGSVISKCLNMQDGGAVDSSGTLIMGSGTITNNRAGNGGGVRIHSNGSVYMTGGTIIGNTASSNGGGVHIDGQYVMLGGTISSNTAGQNGGGVFINGSSTLTMSNGTISGNTATSDGGGVYVTQAGTFIMGGSGAPNPQIISNTAGRNGGGVWTAAYSRLRIAANAVFGRMGTSSANTASSSSDLWPTSAEFIAEFQTPYTPPIGIYSPWGQLYSTTANHPVNNYDINVLVTTHTVTVYYLDNNSPARLLDSDPPNGVTSRTYQVRNGATFALDGVDGRIIPSIPGHTHIDWWINTGPLQGNTTVVVNNIIGPTSIYLVYEETITTTTLSVSKLVAGLYAYREKIWLFTVYFTNNAGTPLPSGTVFNYIITTPGLANLPGTLTLNSGGSATFNLKHGQQIVIDGVPLDARFRIVETPDAFYITSYRDSVYPTVPIVDHDTGGSNNPVPYMLQMTANRSFAFLNTTRDIVVSGIGTNAIYLFGLSLFAGSAGLTYLPAHMLMRMRRGRRWDDMIKIHMEYQAYLAKDDWDG